MSSQQQKITLRVDEKSKFRFAIKTLTKIPKTFFFIDNHNNLGMTDVYQRLKT